MFEQLWLNSYLQPPVRAFVLAQVIKIFLSVVQTRKLDVGRLIGSGGMPSSHSATVSALTVAVGNGYGWDSMPLALSMIFSMVVMYDAAGVRRAAGEQARILNQIIDEAIYDQEFHTEHLKELIGHRPVEVFAGALLGIAVAVYW